MNVGEPRISPPGGFAAVIKLAGLVLSAGALLAFKVFGG